MRRLNTLASLVKLAIFAIVFMFLVVMIIKVLGASAKFFVYFFCIPVAVLMSIFGFILLVLALADVVNYYGLKWKHRERQYRARREQQKIEL